MRLAPLVLLLACSDPDAAACLDYVQVSNACVTAVEAQLGVAIPTLHLDADLTCSGLAPSEDAALFRCFAEAHDLPCATEDDLDAASRAMTDCVARADDG